MNNPIKLMVISNFYVFYTSNFQGFYPFKTYDCMGFTLNVNA